MIRAHRRPLALAAATLAAAASATALLSTAADASPAATSTHASKVETYLRGQVVNQDTGNPVRGVRVTLRDVVSFEVLASDTTDSNGRFRMDDLTEDEYGVKFRGDAVGYENGWLGCGHGVVPTWGEACSFGTGSVGKARLEHL